MAVLFCASSHDVLLTKAKYALRAPSLTASSGKSSMASMMKALSPQGMSRLSMCLGPGRNASVLRKLRKWGPKRTMISCAASLWISSS